MSLPLLGRWRQKYTPCHKNSEPITSWNVLSLHPSSFIAVTSLVYKDIVWKKIYGEKIKWNRLTHVCLERRPLNRRVCLIRVFQMSIKLANCNNVDEITLL